MIYIRRSRYTGSFGKVFLVRDKSNGTLYAMKVLKKDYIIKKNQVEHTKTERSVLSYIHHPFVVGLNMAFQTVDKLFLVLDYCPGGELFLIPVVVIMVGEVSEVSLVGTDASGCGQSLIQAHVGGVRLWPQCVKNGDLHALSECHRGGDDLLAVAEIRQTLQSALLEHQPRGRDAAVRQLEWGDLQVTDFEGPVDHMGLRVEIAEGNRVSPEGVIVDPSQRTKGFLGGIDR